MKVKLESFLQEVSEKTTENNQYPVLTSSKAGLYLQSDYFNKQVASKDNTGYKIIKRGQFTYRAMSDTGEFFPNMLDCTDIGIVSPAYPVFEIAKPIVIPEFLKYYFKSNGFQQSIASFAQGSTRTSIKYGKLKTVLMELPDLKEQQRHVEILDTAQRIINDRKKEIEKLDDLIKARFVELFGTLDNPSQEFAKASLKELCNKITDGKHGGCKAEEGTERYFVGAREIFDDKVHYDTAPEINIEEFEKDYKRCNIEIGDFLIVNTGATIGKSAIATDERTEHTLLQKSVALLKVKKDVLNPVFLKWCYRVNTQMYIVESASAQPNLLLSKINTTVIYVPDIELQNQFAAFVEQVDKSKVVAQQMLDEAQKLFDSLMQEYFG